MRVVISAGDGGGAHSAFYRAEEGVKGKVGGWQRWIFNPCRFQH
jgi:hypothetical protein